jgi:UDP-N-acetylglucosamine acyltransferase
MKIGSHAVIREHVTVHAGTDRCTKVGNGVWLLVGSHIGHDVEIGDHVVVSNATQIAGHVEVGDFVVLGGLVGVQQFCVIGKGAMIGGGAAVDRHVPPYALVSGNRAKFRGINLRGLRRRGIANSFIYPLLTVSKQVYSSSTIIENAKRVLDSSDVHNNIEFSLAKEFLSFIVNVGQVREGWCSRRAGLGIIQ